MQEWLTQPPKYTTFRVNKLKEFDCKTLKEILISQSKELNTNEIPRFYFLTPDCLILEQWPDSVIFTQSENEIVVDALCAAAVVRGAHVFAPGVLGLSPNCQFDERIDIYGDLDGQCKRGLKVKYSGKKLYVGTGRLKMLRSNLFQDCAQPRGIAVHTVLPASRLPIVNETLFPKGQLILQNLPSIVCGWVVNAQPNEYIIDMCAAPGNKTTHLAEMSNNKAYIVAIDKTAQKVSKINENCKNQGVTCVTTYIYNSIKCCSETNSAISEGPPFSPNSFDKVLLDAPCSGLGQRPQLLKKITPKMLESYKFVQRSLFVTAVKLLKVGGTLVYSTCTVTNDENEYIVAWALRKFPCLNIVPAEPLLGGPGLPNCDLNDEQRAMLQRFGPENNDVRYVEEIYRQSIGFFIAKFIKIANC